MRNIENIHNKIMQKVKTERKEKPKKKKTCSEHVRDSSLSSFCGYGRGFLVSLITEQGIGYGQFLVLLRSHSQGTNSNSNQFFVSVTLCICDFKFQGRIHGLSLSLASLNFKVIKMQVPHWLDSAFLLYSLCFSLWKDGGAIYTFMEKTKFYHYYFFTIFIFQIWQQVVLHVYNFDSLVVSFSHHLFLSTF